MTSAALLAELHRAGISLSLHGDLLRVEAKPGALSPDLRERLTTAKPELLAWLQSDLRARLRCIAHTEGLPVEVVDALPDADVAACDGLPDDTLRAYLRALDVRARMDAGLVPLEWGEPVARSCEACGPVLLWAGCPDVVKACPWCFRRKAGKAIPRPPVACCNCRRCHPHPLNPAAGVGACGVGTGRMRGLAVRHD